MKTLCDFTTSAERELDKIGFAGNEFFHRLAGGEMTLDQFQRAQREFYHAVEFFPASDGGVARAHAVSDAETQASPQRG